MYRRFYKKSTDYANICGVSCKTFFNFNFEQKGCLKSWFIIRFACCQGCQTSNTLTPTTLADVYSCKLTAVVMLALCQCSRLLVKRKKFVLNVDADTHKLPGRV